MNLLDSKFAKISTTELNKAIVAKQWYFTNIVIWTTLCVYPFFSIIDYIFAREFFLPFLVVRVILLTIIYGMYDLAVKKKWNALLPVHIALGGISIFQAALANAVKPEDALIFFLCFGAIFIFYNLVAFWKFEQALLHAIFAIFVFVIITTIFNTYGLTTLISNGGDMLCLLILCATFIPKLRYNNTIDDITSRLIITRSNKQLEVQYTEIERQNKVIEETNTKLLQLNKQKNNFIYIAGHDLKNHIGSIMMSASAIKEEEERLSDDQRDFLGFINASAEKMQYLLSKLLDLREIETNEIIFNYEVFEVHKVIDPIVDHLKEMAGYRNIQLQYQKIGLGANVKLDKVFAEQVFQNLISNAVKFSQNNNTIQLITTIERSKFVFEIIDNGKEIGMETLDKMFMKLKSLSEANDQAENRLGLGLSIAKLMTEAMSGTLIYDSSPQIGNYYKVEFDIA